jgi:NTE family protein
MSVTTLHPRGARHRTAFVLGGGGNLGAVQIGMLQALFERDIAPDVLVGCSVGALNAAAIASRPDLEGVEQLRRVWLDPTTWQVFSSGKLTGPWLLLKKARSMVTNERIRRLVEATVPERRFEDFPVPLHVVATSLHTGRPMWFDEGPVVEPILASAALPAVLPPVEIGGEAFIDGGVVDNVPISRAVALGVERVVVLHVGNFERPRPNPQRPLDVLLQAFSIARNERFARESEDAYDGVEVVVLPGVDPGPIKRNDFSKTATLIKRAHATAAGFLDAHPAAASL